MAQLEYSCRNMSMLRPLAYDLRSVSHMLKALSRMSSPIANLIFISRSAEHPVIESARDCSYLFRICHKHKNED